MTGQARTFSRKDTNREFNTSNFTGVAFGANDNVTQPVRPWN
jgi:hypothetical protein